jgi:hypothetical protein
MASWWSLSSWFFHQKPVYIPLLSHVCYMLCLSYSPWSDHYNYIWQWIQLWSSSLQSFLEPLIISFLWDPNILLSTLNLYSSFNFRDHISQPCKSTGKIIFTVILHSHNLRTCHATVTWPLNNMTIKKMFWVTSPFPPLAGYYIYFPYS